MECEIIFQHGWAFDHRCWSDWINDKGLDCKKTVLDRGYFGQSVTSGFSSAESLKIIISHSFGLFLLPESILSKADMLVSISGFREFHTTGREGKFSKRLVNLMLKRFSNGSFDVTSEFRQMCEVVNSSDIRATGEGLEKLAEDLEILSNKALDLEKIRKIRKVLLIQGAEDRIVWPERAEDLKNAIPGSRLFIIQGAGHGLPFTHSKLCIKLFLEHLNSL